MKEMILNRLSGLKSKAQINYNKYFGDTGDGIRLCLSLFIAFLIAGEAPGFDVQNLIPNWIFGIGLVLIYTFILQWIQKGIEKFFSHHISQSAVIVLLLFIAGYYSIQLVRSVSSLGFISSKEEIFIGLAPVGIIFLLGLSLTSLLKNKRYNIFSIGLGVLSLVLFIGMGYFAFFEGFPKERTAYGYENQELPQNYQVEIMDYGKGEFLTFPDVNLSGYANYSGWNKKIREKILGHSLSNVPLTGRIYLPKGKEKAPLLVFAHGNHNMLKPSYLGYEYLGRALAKNGYAFVSIDAAMLNGYLGKGVGNENDARAMLILDHIEKLCEESEISGSPLYRRFDTDSIVVGGHSRGGEAAAIAAYYENMNVLPEDGRQVLEFNYPISGVLAVSPTSDQYQPGDHVTEVEDISYLLIHGTHDMDVNTVQGMSQYARTSLNNSENFKASVLVGGANHGQFNELWGRYDKTFPKNIYINVGDMLDKEAQEKILATYTLAYLEALFNEGSREIFINSKASPYLPEAIYYSQYATGNTMYLANFEEDSDLLSGSDPKVEIDGAELFNWQESGFKFDIGKTSDNHVALLYGGKGDSYRLNFPSKDLEEMDYLTLDLGKEYGGILDLEVELVDKYGNIATSNLSELKDIPDPLAVGLLKWQHISEDWEYKHYLDTIRIPIEAFIQDNENLNLQEIVQMNLVFQGSKQIRVDNIGFVEITNMVD